MYQIRRQEAFLLLPAILTLLAGASLYYLLFPVQENRLLFVVAILIGCGFYSVSLLMGRYAKKAEQLIFPIMAMLTSVGIIILYHIDPGLAVKQCIWTLIGLGCMALVIVFFKHYYWLSEVKYITILVALFFLFLTILMGDEAGGARNWLSLGSFRFQPVEIVKLLVILFAAAYLNEHKRELAERPGSNFLLSEWHSVGPILMITGLLMVLLVVQKDLGAALIIFALLLALFYIATGRLWAVFVGFAGFLLASTITYFLFAHLRARIAIWIDPWPLIDGAGYQPIQSYFALAEGGLVGMGLGMSFPGYIPAVATDFIFSIAGAELGFIGAILLVFLYFTISRKGFKIAKSAPEDFGFLLVCGLTLLFSIQTLVIVGGILKLLPLTGVTLPFMSYGGSSLVINYIMLGLLIKLSSLFRLKEGSMANEF
ncbi:MAG: FtsW/RodA/SpoVE family cell cycle protein [Bacillota bacterium]